MSSVFTRLHYKVCFVSCLVVSLLGWVMFAGGFYGRKLTLVNVEDTYIVIISEDFFPFWCFLITEPLLYILYLFYLCCSRSNKLIKYSLIYFTIQSFVLTADIVYKNAKELLIDDEVDEWIPFELLGALCSTVCFWISLMLSSK